jgi:ribonuclease VapC
LNTCSLLFAATTGSSWRPVDADLAARAMSGWRRYGKGRHPAGLNFGDCFTYALAERTGHPVLCTGDDFAATDITVVRPRLQ